MSEYKQPVAALVRLYRWIRNRCLVCGGHRRLGRPYRYCSMTCGCYDGTHSVRANPNPPLKKSRILTGKSTWKWRPKEEKYL